MGAYIGDRTGVLSFANIALAVLFAGRLNPLIFITGLGQTTCLIFHQWAARVAALQAVVHSIIWTFEYFWIGGGKHITRKLQSCIIGGVSSPQLLYPSPLDL